MIGLVIATPVVGLAGIRAWNENQTRLEQEMAKLLKNNLIESGLDGNRPLVDLREIPGFANQSSGFSIVTENKGGKTIQYLQFAWEASGDGKRSIVSKFEIEKVQFSKASDKEGISSINFGLKGLKNSYENPNDAIINNVKSVVITIADKDAARFNLASGSK